MKMRMSLIGMLLLVITACNSSPEAISPDRNVRIGLQLTEQGTFGDVCSVFGFFQEGNEYQTLIVKDALSVKMVKGGGFMIALSEK